MLGCVEVFVSLGSVNAGGEIPSKCQRQHDTHPLPKPFSPWIRVTVKFTE